MSNELSYQEKRKLALEKAGLPTEIVGQDDIRKEDLLLPRVKLCQGGTKEVKDGKAKVGQFINSVTGEIYADDKLEFVPCAHFLQRIKFTEQLTVECIASDIKNGSLYGQCDRCNYKEFNLASGEKKAQGPECNLVYGFLGMVIKELASKSPQIVDPCIMLSITSTSTPCAKKILSTYKLSKTKLNFWERGWVFSSAQRNEGAQTWLVLQANPGRVFNPTVDADVEIMKMGKELYDWSNTKSIIIDGNEKTVDFDPSGLSDEDVPF